MRIKIINRDYSLLLTGQLISIMGNIINGLAIMWIVYEVLGGQKTGLLFGLSTIPAVIVTPFVGNVVDMFNRKYLLVVCDIIAGLNSFILFLLLKGEMVSFVNLAIIMSIDSILFAMVASTRSSLIQNLVKKNEYLKANSISSLVQNVASISLPMIGAILIARYHISICFLVDGISFIFAAIFTTAINSYTIDRQDEESFLAKFKGGVEYIRTNKAHLSFIFMVTWINFIVASDTLLIRGLVDQTNLDVADFGSFKTSMAVGSISLAFIISKFKKRFDKASIDDKKLMVLALGFESIAYLIFSISGHKKLLIVGGIALGVGTTLFNIMFFTFMQKQIEQTYYGRVISIVFFMSKIAQPLSYWFFGFLMEITSIHLLFVFSGVNLLFISAIFYQLVNKSNVHVELAQG